MVPVSKHSVASLIKTASFCSLVLLFQGCSLFESTPKPQATEQGTSAPVSSSAKVVGENELVYATIGNDEKPFITESEFNAKLDQMLQMYRGQVSAEALPPEAKRKFLDDLIKMRTISTVWADDRDIASEKAFQAMLNERVEAAKEAAIVEFFVQELKEGITVSDGEVSKDYKDNKEKYVRVAGGAQVKAISFDTADAAKDFLKSVKGNADEFEAKAKEASKEHYKNFGFVAQADTDMQMGMMQVSLPEFVKKQVFAEKKFPAIAMANNGQKYWVFCATERKESEYFALDEIKDQLKEMLKESKFKVVLDDRIKELVDKSKIKIKEEYFKRKPAARVRDADKDVDGGNEAVIAA